MKRTINTPDILGNILAYQWECEEMFHYQFLG
jgi:hypothetical protein